MHRKLLACAEVLVAQRAPIPIDATVFLLVLTQRTGRWVRFLAYATHVRLFLVMSDLDVTYKIAIADKSLLAYVTLVWSFVLVRSSFMNL